MAMPVGMNNNFINKKQASIGMITVYKNAHGEFKKGTVQDIRPLHKLLWINSVDPSKEELQLLEHKTQIPIKHLAIAVDDGEMPRATSHGELSIVIFKSSAMKDASCSTPSFGILFNKDYVVTISKCPIPAIESLEKHAIHHAATGVFIDSTELFVYEILKSVLRQYEAVLEKVEDAIDTIEDELIKKPHHDVVQSIFGVKKTLIYLHKALNSNRDVIDRLDRGQLPISKKNLPWFRELYYDLDQLIDMEATYRDVVTGTLDLYVSSISNSINETMKKLTVVASFVLIPTLISGIYGMNFSFMPELEWKLGYPFALGMMVISTLLVFAYFKVKEWV